MKKQIAVIFIFLIIMLLGSCGKKGKDSITEDGSLINIYYINTKTSGIVNESYSLTRTTKEQQVEELLNVLKQAPENIVYKSALPDKVTVKEFNFNNGGRLIINFESTYTELKGVPEVLCRAAIVKTLSQLAEVEYIEFNVNGQPLKDSNEIVVSRTMTAEDFINNVEGESDYKIQLYFADEEGKALIKFVSDIHYTGIGSIEELVIKQLINGPTQIGMYNTIPEGTILLNVTTKEGICYLNFNEKFLEKLPNISDQIAIYSIVNSLVELPNINKVQFTINSEVRKSYREGTPFNVSFERKLDLVKESE